MAVIRDRIRSALSRIENSDASVGKWFAGICSIILIRNLLESAFYGNRRMGLSANFDDSLMRYFFHFPAFYISCLLFIIVVITAMSKENIRKTSKVASSFIWIISAVPFIDIIFTKGGIASSLSYFLTFDSYCRAAVGWLNPLASFSEITPGVRIEIFLVGIGSAFYVWEKNAVKITAAVKAILTFFITSYGIIFIFGSLPMFFMALSKGIITQSTLSLTVKENMFGQAFREIQWDNTVTILCCLTILILSFIAAIQYDSDKFFCCLRNLLPFRTFHFLILMITGILYGIFAASSTSYEFNPGPADYLAMLGGCIGLLLVIQSAACINDLYDCEADKIDKSKRPLASGVITRKECSLMAVFLLLLGLSFAFISCYRSFLMILTFWTNYYLYSAPPFRLKRFFPVNMFIVAGNGLITFFAGTAFFSHIFRVTNSFSGLNPRILLAFLIPYSLAVHIITLKDINADKATGIITLPVLIGEKWAKIVLGGLSLLAFISIAPILGIAKLYLPGFIFGTTAMLIVLRKKWSEKLYFSNYFLFLAVLGYIWLSARLG